MGNANPRALPCDEVAIRSSPRVPACVARKAWVLAAAVLGSTLAFIDESVVNVALPRIESDLEATLAAMQWVVNAYTLCLSALLLVGGAAADQFGRRRVFGTRPLDCCEFSGDHSTHRTVDRCNAGARKRVVSCLTVRQDTALTTSV